MALCVYSGSSGDWCPIYCPEHTLFSVKRFDSDMPFSGQLRYDITADVEKVSKQVSKLSDICQCGCSFSAMVSFLYRFTPQRANGKESL